MVGGGGGRRPAAPGQTDILVPQVLQQLQLPVRPLREHRGAEGLHDLLDGDILVGELVPRGAVEQSASVSNPLIACGAPGGRRRRKGGRK